MVRISQVPNIPADVAAKLKAQKVRTQADLWEKIGPNFKEGIQKVAQSAEVDSAELRKILKQPPADPSTKAEGGWARFFLQALRHWGEVLALFISVILLFLLIRNATQRQNILVVSAPGGLPAFHIIKPDDVHLENKFAVHDSLTSNSDVIGRYLLQPLAPKAVLLNSQLGSPELKQLLTGREVLTLPVKTTAISPTLAPGDRVCLLFSPRNTAAEPKPRTQSQIITDLTIDDLIVLAAARQPDSSSITLAFKNQEDVSRALALLTTADVLIAERR